MAAVEERAELHKTIWRIANDLRGSVDGWDFKSYVLGFLFYRYISENLTEYVNASERDAILAEGGSADEANAFDYAALSDEVAESDRAGIIKDKGFFIRPSDLFANVRTRAASDENLNETLAQAFRSIEDSAKGSGSESDLRGLFDDVDVNATKLGNTVAERNAKLVKIMESIGDLPLDHAGAKIDAFGDAYEFLMKMYASSAGKSGGEFYTPQEVAQVLAMIAADGRKKVGRVYDPCAGSGSLLLKFAKILGVENVGSFYGQEINLTTYNLCRINMFLHDVNFSNFDIALGDTLTAPAHWDAQPFDAIVSNPPYSTRWEGEDNPALISDPRFAPAGKLAPRSKADLAFTMHMLHWLAEDGTAAIVEFPGVLYRGAAEGKIRRSSSKTTSCTRSSSCRRTCSSGRRSRPASSCSRRRAPIIACSSWTRPPNVCVKGTRIDWRRRISSGFSPCCPSARRWTTWQRWCRSTISRTTTGTCRSPPTSSPRIRASRWTS